MKYNMVTRRTDGVTLFELEHGRPERAVADEIACVLVRLGSGIDEANQQSDSSAVG